MERQVTLGNLLTILVGIIFPVFIWGVYVEKKMDIVDRHEKSIELLETNQTIINANINKNHIEMMRELNEIKLALKDKKDRE